MGSLQYINKICPRCGNPNYMVSLDGICKKTDRLRIKCINCNSYFTLEEIYGKGEKEEKKMDAVEYLKERARMLRSDQSCYTTNDFISMENTGKEEEAVHVVEQWSKGNPAVTNMQKFLEVFGVTPKLWHLNKDGFDVMSVEEADWWKDSWWNELYKEPDHG